MSAFALAPKPASLLGYHRVLAPTAGVKVSPLCLGTMNFGTKWYCPLRKYLEINTNQAAVVGRISWVNAASRNPLQSWTPSISSVVIFLIRQWEPRSWAKIFQVDCIYRANNYQNEESEIWLGEWMKERGNRDQLV